MILKNIHMWAKGMYTKIFMVVLFVYNKNIWKPLKFPLIGYRLNKVWFMRIVRVFLNVQCVLSTIVGFLDGSVVKNLPGNTGDTGSTSGLKRVPGEGNGNLLQYCCLGNPMDREDWQATVHGVTKSWTQPSD